MLLSRGALFAAAASAFVQPAAAVERRDFDIPAGRLGDAVIALGRQGGITIGTADNAIASIRVRGVRGRLTPEQALRRLLAGSALRAVRIDGQSFRIVRDVRESRPPRRPAPAVIASQPLTIGDIIVTASKRSAPIASFPATVQIFDLGGMAGPPSGESGTKSLLAQLPMLASTELGRGRNKLFIRGVADSSFTGPTQATVGQYLGEIRLNYNAPDPDLSLYDISRVELVEGPQGTLYGAGSLGGVVRLIPRKPDTTHASASVSAGATATRYGAWGHDVAGMVNVPLLSDRAALRVVAYEVRDEGYIDDLARDLRDVNRTRIRGGRAALRVTPGVGWTVDLGGVFQVIDARDSQYAERDARSLSRRSAIAQPFDNDYALWHATVRKQWRDADLVSATGYVRHDVGQRYDATGDAGPIAFDEDDNIRLLTHETRISGRGANGGNWLLGVALVRDTDNIDRRLGAPGATRNILGVRNAATEASLFGEGTLALTHDLSGTLGARVTYSHLSGHAIGAPDTDAFEPARDEKRMLPTAAISWKPLASLLTFVRYQEGFRAGGLSVGQGEKPAVTRFRSDRLRAIEAGFRFGDAGSDPLSGAATLSYTRWRNIQADLILPGSLPTTVNIGNGRIYGFEASATWKPMRSFATSFALFLNDGGLGVPPSGAGEFEVEELPNIAKIGAVGTVGWRTEIGPNLALAAEASARYVGASRLGIGPLLDLRQGNYLDTSLTMRLEWRAVAMSVGVTNLADARGNRFALGNPFGADPAAQTTPLRPRSVRIGLDAKF